MSNFYGGMTLASTGAPVTISGVGFLPTNLKFTVTSKSGNSANIVHALGWVDETGYEGAHSMFSDASGAESKNFSDRCLYVRDRVSGTITTVVEANFHSFTNDGFKLNVTTANPNYQVWIEATNV